MEKKYGFLRREECNFDKKDLIRTPDVQRLENIRATASGRVNVIVRDDVYECYIKKSHKKRLFVFLNAAGRISSKTEFNRASWSAALEGNSLYIDDPMYKIHEGLTGGWYYGDSRRSFLDGAVEIINKFCEEKNITSKDVIFIGSSASGYAALYMADKISGSMALAYNPQIRLKDWPYAKTFEKITGQNLSSDDILKRNCLRYIQKNVNSKFVICCNIDSHLDYELQIKPWFDEAGASLEEGCNIMGSVNVIAFKTPSLRPHYVFPDVYQTAILLGILKYSPDPHSEVKAFFREVTRITLLNQKLHLIKKWSRVLHGGFGLNSIYTPHFSDNAHAILKCSEMPDTWHYELVLDRNLENIYIEFHIENIKDELQYGVIASSIDEHLPNISFKHHKFKKISITEGPFSESEIKVKVYEFVKRTESGIRDVLSKVSEV